MGWLGMVTNLYSLENSGWATLHLKTSTGTRSSRHQKIEAGSKGPGIIIQIQKSAETHMHGGSDKGWILWRRKRKTEGPVESLRSRREGEPKKTCEKTSQSSIFKKDEKRQRKEQKGMLQVPVSSQLLRRWGRKSYNWGNLCLGYTLC